jgi:hypothetical protein
MEVTSHLRDSALSARLFPGQRHCQNNFRTGPRIEELTQSIAKVRRRQGREVASKKRELGDSRHVIFYFGISAGTQVGLS